MALHTIKNSVEQKDKPATEASDAPEGNTDDESDTVSQMAKSATDLDDSPLG